MPEAQTADEKQRDDALTELTALFKELSLALIENAKATRGLLAAFVSGVNTQTGEEETGLLDQFAELSENVESLDQHVIGQNVLLSRINFVGDKILSVYKGEPDATPPVPARTPTLADVCAALDEFDKNLEEEADKAQKEDEEAEKEEGVELPPDLSPDLPPAPGEPPKPPQKTPMLSNLPPSPVFGKKLPPTPVMQQK